MNLNINNNLNEPIQIMLSESPGWKLLANFATAAELAAAAAFFVANLPPMAAVAAPTLAEWSTQLLLMIRNQARVVLQSIPSSLPKVPLLLAAEALIESIGKATVTLGAGQHEMVMNRTLWSNIFTVDGLANLFGVQTLNLTIFTQNTRRALHLKSTIDITWTLSDAGATDSNGNFYPWDGFVVAAAEPALAVDDEGRFVLFWGKPDGTLGSTVLSFRTAFPQSPLPFNNIIDGIAAAPYKSLLYVAYTHPFNGPVPIGVSRQGYYAAGTVGSNWDSERGNLRSPSIGRFAGDFIGKGGISLSGDDTYGLRAAFHDTDDISTILVYHDDGDPSSSRLFGHVSNVYAPDGSPLHSQSRPSIARHNGQLYIAVQEIGKQMISVYIVDETEQRSTTTPHFGVGVDAYGPTLGVASSGLHLVYSSPKGVFIANNEGPRQVTDIPPASLVAFAADGDLIVLAWRSQDNSLKFAVGGDEAWFGPYSVGDFFDPAHPAG